MKKTISLLIVLSFVIIGCADSKYAEVIKVMNELTEAYNIFNGSLEKAATDDDVVAAMESLIEKVKVLVPESKELNKKFPEIKSRNTMPEELKEPYNLLREAGRNMIKIYETDNMKKIINSPKVKKTNKKLLKVIFD